MKVLGNAVLILPDGLPDKTGSGIIIPKTVEELPPTGVVKAIGNKVEEVKVGDKVRFARKSGSAIYIEDVEHLLVPEDKIQFIY